LVAVVSVQHAADPSAPLHSLDHQSLLQAEVVVQIVEVLEVLEDLDLVPQRTMQLVLLLGHHSQELLEQHQQVVGVTLVGLEILGMVPQEQEVEVVVPVELAEELLAAPQAVLVEQVFNFHQHLEILMGFYLVLVQQVLQYQMDLIKQETSG